jgi:ABC-2 type transport system ATP-binding protein
MATAWGVKDLHVRYGRHEALRGVTLEARPGAVTAVVGGDGAGKTSLLRALAGALKPSAGSVRRPPSQRIGYASGDAGVYRDLSVDENLAFTATAYGLRGEDFHTRAEELLAQTGLDAARERLGDRLSGGMRQKLALIMALVHKPELLVLDEPTTGLDPVSRAELWRLIALAAAGGRAVVLATTYLNEAERAAFVQLRHEGRALAGGSPDELVAAMPGTLLAVGRQPSSSLAWRRGAGWHVWLPPAATLAAGEPTEPPAAPPIGSPIQPDLEDVAVVAMLASQASPGAAPGADTPGDAGRSASTVGSIRRSASTPGRIGESRALDEALVLGEALSRRFGELVAVDDVDLAVRPGEVVGLLGANGAGKTTLIRLLIGLLRATSGRIRLFGRAPSRATRARLGYVPQGLGLYDDLTLAENLAFYAGAFGAAPAPLTDPDLRSAAGTLVRDLPLGIRRRAAFVAALAHHPELLVLDEPTSGVDPLARARLWDTVRETAEAGAGALVTTHHMEEAANCDRLVIMALGRVVAEGSLAGIVGRHTAVLVESEHWSDAFAALDGVGVALALAGRSLRAPDADPARVSSLLEESGITARVSVVPATLEETFVELARGSRSSGEA